MADSYRRIVLAARRWARLSQNFGKQLVRLY